MVKHLKKLKKYLFIAYHNSRTISTTDFICEPHFQGVRGYQKSAKKDLKQLKMSINPLQDSFF